MWHDMLQTTRAGWRWRDVLWAAVLLSLVWGCALWSLGTPPGQRITPRACVGTFVYPDSAGHCIPRDSTGRAS